jgi:predicted RNA binding protein YcfA (HicA-like mRNA interferase family)
MRAQLPHLAMRKQKLLQRLTNNPKGATFDDIRTLLLYEGFKLDRITGSHHIFTKAGLTFVIPVHANRVKSVYVRRVIALIKGETK